MSLPRPNIMPPMGRPVRQDGGNRPQVQQPGRQAPAGKPLVAPPVYPGAPAGTGGPFPLPTGKPGQPMYGGGINPGTPPGTGGPFPLPLGGPNQPMYGGGINPGVSDPYMPKPNVDYRPIDPSVGYALDQFDTPLPPAGGISDKYMPNPENYAPDHFDTPLPPNPATGLGGLAAQGGLNSSGLGSTSTNPSAGLGAPATNTGGMFGAQPTLAAPQQPQAMKVGGLTMAVGKRVGEAAKQDMARKGGQGKRGYGLSGAQKGKKS